jgi:hypothetical protein
MSDGRRKGDAHVLSLTQKRGRSCFVFAFGSAAGVEGPEEAEAAGSLVDPLIGSQGAIALQCSTHGGQFWFGQGFIDQRCPVARTIERPGGEQAGGEGLRVVCQAGPRPGLGAVRQFSNGAERVGFDVANEREQMMVFLHEEAFEATLVDVALAVRVIVLVIAADVGVGEPAHEGGELAVVLGEENEVKVVGHEAIAQQSYGGEALARFGQELDEGGVVGFFAEDGAAGIATIEDVEDESAGGDAGTAGHGGSIRGRLLLEKMSAPFVLPPLFCLRKDERPLCFALRKDERPLCFALE